MTDDVLGWGIIALFATMVAAVALLWRRRPLGAVVTVGTVRGQRRTAPLPFQDMVHLYSTSSTARDELGGDEVIQRARGVLAELPRPSGTATSRRRLTGVPVAGASVPQEQLGPTCPRG